MLRCRDVHTRISRAVLWASLPAIVGALIALAQPTSVPGAQATGLNTERIAAACGSPNPYLASTRLVDDLGVQAQADRPVVFAFRDTPNDDPTDQVPLATYAQVGAVHGLAYDAASDLLYAGAYLKRGVLFGAAGPGGVYRIDLASGDVATWARLPAGDNPHAVHREQDAAVTPWLGRLGLGDLELGEDGRSLFVSNLFDGRVYRLNTSDPADVRSFAHGGAGTTWGTEARPFGLAWRDGWLFHGAVDRLGASLAVTVPVGHVYRSRADGSDMTSVAAFPLGVAGQTVGYGGWGDGDLPVIADIAFRPNGDIVVGVRNLRLDAELETDPYRSGDVLLGAAVGDAFYVSPAPEAYNDSVFGMDETATGGLAAVPGLDLLVAAGHFGYPGNQEEAAIWLDGRTGDQVRAERLTIVPEWNPLDPIVYEPTARISMGDVEALCASDQPLDPSLLATATEEAGRVATATRSAVETELAARATTFSGTATALMPTLTAMAPTRAALATDIARTTVAPPAATASARRWQDMNARCRTDDPSYAIASLGGIDYLANKGGVKGPIVAAFNQTDPVIALARWGQTGRVYGLGYDALRGHLYAASYIPPVRLTDTGPHGFGAIYRIDLPRGTVHPWNILWAGDQVGAWATYRDGLPRIGFGDIEVDGAGESLWAVNLGDSSIYRMSLPDGAVTDVFAHGAALEPWGDDALPFALAWRDGYLYHGVVETIRPFHRNRLAAVYRSRSDGSEMTRVAITGLSYLTSGRAGSHAHAFLADIEFTSAGDPVLGLRDGAYGRSGDVLPTLPRFDGWLVASEPEYFDDITTHDEAVVGSLARSFDGKTLVAAADAVKRYVDTGALWIDLSSGHIVARRQLFDYSYSADRRKGGSMLGDVELLCPRGFATPTATDTASPTPTSTYTPTSTPTPTATSTATPTPTVTSTPTPVPEPVFLPLILTESCVKRRVHADVALVIDASTSMGRPTRDGRLKLDAVQDAARTFVDLMELADDGPRDQVAVAGFNGTAWIEQAMTGDEPALRRAIDALPDGMAQGTRLDLAVEIGLEALAHPSRIGDNTAVIVLMTDGLPNRVPLGPGGSQEETVLAAAARAHDAGVLVYTIGVGLPNAPDIADRINAQLLTDMAGNASRFFQTVDAAELARIYAQIAATIGCPPESYWGRR